MWVIFGGLFPVSFAQQVKEVVYRFPDGQIQERYFVIQMDSKLKHHGSYQRYNQSGVLIESGDYDFGRRIGLWTRLDRSSQKTETVYENGEKTAETRYASSGARIESSHYAHGKKHGVTRKWLESGQLVSKSHFINGKKHGLEETWWPNGQIKQRVEWVYTEGSRQSSKRGIETLWHENAQKKRVILHCHADDGAVSNYVWKEWDKNGHLVKQYPAEKRHLIPCLKSFPSLHTGSAGYQIELQVTAPGFGDRKVTVPLEKGRPSEILIQGLVSDNHNQPVAGATVRATGFEERVVADELGMYRLKLEPGGSGQVRRSKNFTLGRFTETEDLCEVEIVDKKQFSVPGSTAIRVKVNCPQVHETGLVPVHVTIENESELPFLEIQLDNRNVTEDGFIHFTLHATDPEREELLPETLTLLFQVGERQHAYPLKLKIDRTKPGVEESAKTTVEKGLVDQVKDWNPVVLALLGLFAMVLLVLLLVLAALVLWYMRRLLLAMPVAFIFIVGSIFLFNYFTLSRDSSVVDGILVSAIQPHSDWTYRHEWVPLFIWVLGGLTVGLFIRGSLRGILAGLLTGITIWSLAAFEAFDGSWKQMLNIDQFIAQHSEDFVVSTMVIVVFSFLGGLFTSSIRAQQGLTSKATLRHEAFNHFETYHGEEEETDWQGFDR